MAGTYAKYSPLTSTSFAPGGTVTSVGLSAPPIFTVSGSPVTGLGTLTLALNPETANTVLAGPSSGASAVPTFRTLTSSDIPSLPYALDAFTIIQTDLGTSPTATTTTSTLTLKNTDGTVAITGDSVTNTVTLNLNTIPASKGGTGLTSPGASGNVLQSNGTTWTTVAVAGATPFTGDTGTGGTQGAVPAPAAGTKAAGDFLSANGTWTYVDQSKPIYPSFSLINKTSIPGTSKVQSVVPYTAVNGKQYAAVMGGANAPTLALFDITNQAAPVLLSTMSTLQGAYNSAHAIKSVPLSR